MGRRCHSLERLDLVYGVSSTSDLRSANTKESYLIVNYGFKHYKQYSRCKDHLKGKQAKFVLDNPLLELDNQIEATYKSYLV